MQLDFCPHCFSATNANYCSQCGFDIASYEWKNNVLKPGTVISNKYKIGRVLGIGGFGITYVACEIATNTRYAIKEFMPNNMVAREENGMVNVTDPKDKESFQSGKEMFLVECNILHSLSGTPHIVQEKDLIAENNTLYLVMEYLDGENLKSILRNQGPVTGDFALEVLLKISSALRTVHSYGILHRDISPENIMLLKDGDIKLIDFGAARYFIGEKNKDLSLILKPGFAPPEQYSSEGRQGEWTDIYALAATYYKIITGKTLPDAREREDCDTLERLDGKYPGISPHVGAAIHKALSLDSRDRYQNINQFLAALNPEMDKQQDNENNTSPQKTEDISQPRKWKKIWSEIWGRPGKSESPETFKKTPSPKTPSPKTPFKKTPKPYVRVVNNTVTVGYKSLYDDTLITIGRDSSCDLAIPGNSISRKHCSVKYNSQQNTFAIVDYSSNGTFFSNGARLDRFIEYTLSPGSIIVLASQEFIMEVGVK